jgi:hypothetical protein
MTFLIVIGDLWLSLNIESMKYSFFFFIAANILGIIHFYINRSFSLMITCAIIIVVNCFAIFNYFDKNIDLSLKILVATILLLSLIFIRIGHIKYTITTRKSKTTFFKELLFSLTIIAGVLLMSFDIPLYSLIGFVIWALSSPLGFIVANDIQSKGLFLQVLVYIPIELYAIYAYSESNEWIFIYGVLSIIFLLSINLLDLKYKDRLDYN